MTRKSLTQHNQGYIWKTYSHHYTKWGNSENIHPKIENQARVFTVFHLIQRNAIFYPVIKQKKD